MTRKVTKEVSKEYAARIDNYVSNKLNTELNREATFQDFIEAMIKGSTYEKTEQFFDVFTKAWVKTGRQIENKDYVYNKYFGDTSSTITTSMAEFIEPTQAEVVEDRDVKKYIIIGLVVFLLIVIFVDSVSLFCAGLFFRSSPVLIIVFFMNSNN